MTKPADDPLAEGRNLGGKTRGLSPMSSETTAVARRTAAECRRTLVNCDYAEQAAPGRLLINVDDSANVLFIRPIGDSDFS